MRIIIGVSLLSIAGLAGCASSGAGSADQAPPPPVRETVRISTTGASGASGLAGMSDMTVTSGPNVGIVTVAAPFDKVWKELIEVYKALGIEASTVDMAGRTIGNPSFKARRRLGNVPMTKYIDCGTTQGTQSAETYELLLTIHSQLHSPTPNNTTVTTTFSSMGRPVNISSEYRTCTSTNALEQAIADLLRVRLGV